MCGTSQSPECRHPVYAQSYSDVPQKWETMPLKEMHPVNINAAGAKEAA